MEEHALLAETSVQLTDTLVEGRELADLLALLSRRAVQLVGAAGAGVILTDDTGDLRLCAASSERLAMLQRFELEIRQGPGLEAHGAGEPVFVADLAAHAERWPRFVERALGEGHRGVDCFPIRLREHHLGALSLFRDQRQGLSEKGAAYAQTLVHAAAIGVVHRRALSHCQENSRHLQRALESRVVIEQAKGILAERLGVGVDIAFDRLRYRARSSNRPLHDVARDVVESPPLR